MTDTPDARTTRDIVVECVLPQRPEIVWKTLTTSDLIGRWLMPNDFEPRIGGTFTFRAKPMGDWDGIVHCEVLDIVSYRKLVYSWKAGSDNNPNYGARLETLVTWTLTQVGDGTALSLVHSGFRSPQNDFAFNAMSPGWSRVLASIGRIAEEQA